MRNLRSHFSYTFAFLLKRKRTSEKEKEKALSNKTVILFFFLIQCNKCN